MEKKVWEIVTVDGFFEALDNDLLLSSEWLVNEAVERDVRLWLEESENRDWTFAMDEEPIDGVYKVTIIER